MKSNRTIKLKRKPSMRNHAQIQKPEIKRIANDYDRYSKEYERGQKTGQYFADPRD